MKKTISAWDFIGAFENSEERKNQFSRSALHSLFDYYEEIEEETGESIEFDMIAICCEWTEYDNFEAIQNDYSSYNFETIEDVKNYTNVIETDCETFLIGEF